MADAPLSPRNARVTAARRLLRAKTSDHEGRFLVEGPQAVREALQSERPLDVVHEAFVTVAGRAKHSDLVDRALERWASGSTTSTTRRWPTLRGR